MSKLVGKRKQDYLAHVVGQEPAVDAAAAAKLTERLDGAIRSLRVTKADLAALKAETKPQSTAPVRAPDSTKPTGALFDPYAFNAILVFKRSGRDALITKLAGIGEASQLRQLAEAQLIGLDQDMRSGSVAIEDLREAVLRGVERLVADRRAAAS
jgi:hypothetical protein